MRLFLVVSWRHESGFYARAFADDEEEIARDKAYSHNAVLVEMVVDDLGRVYVDMFDYEFQNDNREPAPVSWQDDGYELTRGGWKPRESPVARVGHEIGRKEFRRLK